MMNVMFVLLAKRAFSDVIEDVYSENISLAPLSCSKSIAFCLNSAIYLLLTTFTISRTFMKLAVTHSSGTSISCFVR